MTSDTRHVDVSGMVSDWYRCPVFFTRQLWDRCIVPPTEVRSFFQNEQSRVLSVIEAMNTAAWSARSITGNSLPFVAKLRFQPRPRPKQTVALIAVATLPEHGSAGLITVMLDAEA